MNSNQVRRRMITLVLLPVLFCLLISCWLLISLTQTQIDDQANRFGKFMSRQLANTSIDYLVNNDLLSLNVLLEDLVTKNQLDFAAVYNQNNTLVAQSGQQVSSAYAFTSDISFQDANLGYVLLELDATVLTDRVNYLLGIMLGLHLFTALGVAIAIWFYGDILFVWITRSSEPSEAIESEPQVEEEKLDQLTVLMYKIKPARLIPVDAIEQAARLYRAQIDSIGDEEFQMSFDTVEQVERSLCCASLIAEILNRVPHRIQYRAAIDLGKHEDAVTLRKQVSYMASLAEQNCLLSTRFHGGVSVSQAEKFGVSQFHSSLTGDGEFYTLTQVDPLLSQQADQLFGSSPR